MIKTLPYKYRSLLFGFLFCTTVLFGIILFLTLVSSSLPPLSNNIDSNCLNSAAVQCPQCGSDSDPPPLTVYPIVKDINKSYHVSSFVMSLELVPVRDFLIARAVIVLDRLSVVGFIPVEYSKVTVPSCSLPDDPDVTCTSFLEFGSHRFKTSKAYQAFIVHYKLSSTSLSSSSVTLSFANSQPVNIPIYQQPYISFLSACIPTLYKVNVTRVSQWVNYYTNNHELDSVTLYVTRDFIEKDKSDFESNLIVARNLSIDYVIVPPLFETKQVFYHGQSLSVYDCLLKSMYHSFVFFQDLDEFLVFEPGFNLNSLLNLQDIGGITFGSQRYSLDYCTEPYIDPPTSMPIPTDSLPECDIRDTRRNKTPASKAAEINHQMCLINPGRRKHVVKPTSIASQSVHRLKLFKPFKLINLDTRIGYLKHYRGFVDPTKKHCSKDILDSFLLIHEGEF
ncbi:hypothetical protein RCL1_005929 [Eukaryota sp. TZLM3-RCL]